MSYTIKTGDTWPPMRRTLTESCKQGDVGWYSLDNKIVRRADFFTDPPDSIRLILKPNGAGAVVDGPCVNVEVVEGSSATVGLVAGQDPGLGVPINRGQVDYFWLAGDSDVADTYKGEVEVTVDSTATPPRIETFPNDSANNFIVIMVGDLD